MAYKFVVAAIIAHVCLSDGFPLHASCKIDWTFNARCDIVMNRILGIMNRWSGPENCRNGGEKCNYKVTSNTTNEIKGVHETPVKHYKDDLTFTFKSSATGCNLHGYSTSEIWYALLDKGTNYCNLHNLITGADLDRDSGYSEMTSNSKCTQFSSANCDKY